MAAELLYATGLVNKCLCNWHMMDGLSWRLSSSLTKPATSLLLMKTLNVTKDGATGNQSLKPDWAVPLSKDNSM